MLHKIFSFTVYYHLTNYTILPYCSTIGGAVSKEQYTFSDTVFQLRSRRHGDPQKTFLTSRLLHLNSIAAAATPWSTTFHVFHTRSDRFQLCAYYASLRATILISFAKRPSTLIATMIMTNEWWWSYQQKVFIQDLWPNLEEKISPGQYNANLRRWMEL